MSVTLKKKTYGKMSEKRAVQGQTVELSASSTDVTMNLLQFHLHNFACYMNLRLVMVGVADSFWVCVMWNKQTN